MGRGRDVMEIPSSVELRIQLIQDPASVKPFDSQENKYEMEIDTNIQPRMEAIYCVPLQQQQADKVCRSGGMDMEVDTATMDAHRERIQDVPVKFSAHSMMPQMARHRSKPSAIRDFPKGCARNAFLIRVSLDHRCAIKDSAIPLGSTQYFPRRLQQTLRRKATKQRILKLIDLINSLLEKDATNSIIPSSPGRSAMMDAINSRAAVKRTLHDFDALRRFFGQLNRGGGSSGPRRPDLQAATRLKEKGRWVNCQEKWVGQVPGIEVGDQFYYRIEMCIVGLHRQVQAGIDYIPGSRMTDGKCIGTSIIASGGYEDDVDDGETLVYTGQGGNNYGGDRRQSEDQELVRGNLALKNSCRRRSPIRVIRGCKELGGCQGKSLSLSRTIYNYDGLYLVSKYWTERGKSGFLVYKFLLKRINGQPKLGSAIVKFLGNVKKKKVARLHMVVEDISEGTEKKPVCVVNEVDDEPRPAYFRYVSKVLYPSWLHREMGAGCDCVGGCVDPDLCLCAARNGGCFPYEKDGALCKRMKMVYECGINCKCSETCQNRVSQNGLRYRLEIFKTEKKGWGVRSWDSIPYGGFICEYTGELLSDMEAEQRVGNDDYLFDIGPRRNTNDHFGDISDLIDTAAAAAAAADCNNSLCCRVEDSGFTIDAANFGNVARFINHSCSPNLIAQDVIFDHHSLDCPHVMLFSMDNIPPLTELTYDYNYTVGQVLDSDGNAKRKDCYCGSPFCVGRLY